MRGRATGILRAPAPARRALGLLALAAMLLGGCAFPWAPTPTPAASGPDPAPTLAARVEPTQTSPTPLPTGAPPTAPTVAPTGVPSSAPPVATTAEPTVLSAAAGAERPPTAAEAEGLLRKYFAALGEERYEDAAGLTTGQARTRTASGERTIRQEEDANGVTVDLRVPRLTARAGEPEGARRPVAASYTVEAWADTLLGAIKAREFDSSATFSVERLPEGLRIVRIDGRIVPE